MTSKFGQFGRPGQFFSAFSGFGVSTFQKLQILGGAMILRENVKCWSKSGQGGIFLCLDVNKLGGHLGGLWGQQLTNIY